ncbi:MAG: VOC family protein [Pseudonocardia sp.]
MEACREFYAEVGLPLVREQHGTGPVHFAAELPGGLVLELYPGQPGRTTERLRLGFTVGGGQRVPGTHTLTDPDGRTVVITVQAPGMTTTTSME